MKEGSWTLIGVGADMSADFLSELGLSPPAVARKARAPKVGNGRVRRRTPSRVQEFNRMRHLNKDAFERRIVSDLAAIRSEAPGRRQR
jgi:hypothetical protein